MRSLLLLLLLLVYHDFALSLKSSSKFGQRHSVMSGAIQVMVVVLLLLHLMIMLLLMVKMMLVTVIVKMMVMMRVGVTVRVSMRVGVVVSLTASKQLQVVSERTGLLLMRVGVSLCCLRAGDRKWSRLLLSAAAFSHLLAFVRCSRLERFKLSTALQVARLLLLL